MKGIAGVDITNYFCVGSSKGCIKILNPPAKETFITKDEALVLAAWIVVQADPFGERFKRILKLVENT